MRFFTDICPTQGGLARIQKCQLSEEFYLKNKKRNFFCLFVFYVHVYLSSLLMPYFSKKIGSFHFHQYLSAIYISFNSFPLFLNIVFYIFFCFQTNEWCRKFFFVCAKNIHQWFFFLFAKMCNYLVVICRIMVVCSKYLFNY